MKINIVGMDPSMNNWGVAIGTLDTKTLEVDITDLRITKTNSEKGKTVRTNSDDLRRAVELKKGTEEVIKDAQIVFVEVPHGSQSARAMASYGVCIGVLAAIDQPLIQVSALEVKKTIGNKKASKKESIAWAMEKQPNAPWAMKTVKGVTSSVDGTNEHLSDAVAAIYAGMETAEFKHVLNLVTKFSVAA